MSTAVVMSDQSRMTEVLAEVAIMLLEYGAESRLIEQIPVRIGSALGCDRVDMALIPSAVTLTTRMAGQAVTTTRRTRAQSLNMGVVHDILQLCIHLERHPAHIDDIEQQLRTIKPHYYPQWVLIPVIGLACAAFSHLHGADWPGFMMTFLAAAVGMWVRTALAKRRYPALISFAITAFVSTSVASLALLPQLSRTPNLVISASVLLLVPGFPFVNAFLDAFKGYLSMGWGRWLEACLLTLMTSLGIILASRLLNIHAW